MKPKAWIIAAIVALGSVLLLGVAIDVVGSSPKVCASCHELQPRAHAWSRSAHRSVPCTKCHLPVRAWYQLPQRVSDKVGLLRRDVAKHFAGGFTDPVDQRSAGTPPMSDEVCLQCHDANRKATSGFRILIDHPEHAKRNGSCVSCHVRTAHPIAQRSPALSLMTQCFTCHGSSTAAKAPGDCAMCHPADYQLFPASHKARDWKREHGAVSEEDPRQCRMCHKQTFCRNCHGLEMPHPKRWARGRTGHGVVAKTSRAICSRCHEGGPDLCTMCHHDSYQPAKGTWVRQHYATVRVQGLGRCLECHSPVFCSGCHVRWAAAGK